MIFRSHLLSMILYSLFVCITLALIRKSTKKEQFKYGIVLFSIMVAGSLLLGWAIYLFF